MGTNSIMPKQKSSAARPAAADPYPKKGGKQGSEPQESQDVGGESQDIRGGHPKPQGDHTGEPRKEQTALLDRTELCVSCNKKLMMMQLNASGVLAGNIRFVLRLALNSIYCWIQPL